MPQLLPRFTRIELLFDPLALPAGHSYGACERRDRPPPFLVIGSLSRTEVDPDRTELGGARRLRSAAEDIGAPGDLESHEPRGHDRGVQLCFQQSTGDSALPEIDVSFAGLGHGF